MLAPFPKNIEGSPCFLGECHLVWFKFKRVLGGLFKHFTFGFGRPVFQHHGVTLCLTPNSHASLRSVVGNPARFSFDSLLCSVGLLQLGAVLSCNLIQIREASKAKRTFPARLHPFPKSS